MCLVLSFGPWSFRIFFWFWTQADIRDILCVQDKCVHGVNRSVGERVTDRQNRWNEQDLTELKMRAMLQV